MKSRFKETLEVILSNITTVLKISNLDILCETSTHKSEWWDTDISPDGFAVINVAHGSVGLPCCGSTLMADGFSTTSAWFSSTKLVFFLFFFQSVPNLYGRCVTAIAFVEFSEVSTYLSISIGWQTSRTLLTSSSLVQVVKKLFCMVQVVKNNRNKLTCRTFVATRAHLQKRATVLIQSTWGLLILSGIIRLWSHLAHSVADC